MTFDPDLCEGAHLLVDHLDDADDLAADADGHAEDGLGVVAGLLVDAAVEARVGGHVLDVERLARLGHVARDAHAHGKPEMMMVGVLFFDDLF